MSILRCFISIIFSVLFIHSTAYAAPNDESKGKLIYEFKHDYADLYRFLRIDEKEYRKDRKQGKSIAEIAKEHGISEESLIRYYVIKHYDEMQKWRKKGNLNEEDYFETVFRLKEDILHLIHEKVYSIKK